MFYRDTMGAIKDNHVHVPPYRRILITRQVDFLLVLLPIMLWAGIAYYFLFEQDPHVNQWLDSKPFWLLFPVVFTFLSLIIFIYRAKQIQYLFSHGKRIKGKVLKVSTKRHSTRFFLPIKTIVAYEYHYKGKHYKRRIYLLSSEYLKPGMNVHIHVDPKSPKKSLIREAFIS